MTNHGYRGTLTIGLLLMLGSAKWCQAAEAAQKPGITATYSAPLNWKIMVRPGMVLADAPEGDAHVAIVDVGQVGNAKAAAAYAWSLYQSTGKWPVEVMTPSPAREGWDERQTISYRSSPEQHVFVQAVALRRGSMWTVVIVDGSESTIDKRAASVELLINSVRPKGYVRESFSGLPAHQLDAARIEAIRKFVATSIDQLGIPGAAIALSDHGRIVYEGGVGIRALGKPEPVDAHTLFMIASNTKGMTTLLLSELVDRNKIQWDEPVVSAYPLFRLGSDATTEKVLMKHLVCACTGVPRKDLEMVFTTRASTPAANTFAQLSATQPTSGFGEVFQYNNLMAAAAGYVAAHTLTPGKEAGAAYDEAMQSQVFDPLGMTETTFSMERALSGNHASPHGNDVDGKPTVSGVDFDTIFRPFRPAGGAWSSAHDLIKYVGVEISEGVLPNGRRLVSRKNLLARRTRGVPTGENAWYGMGLEEDATWGVSVIHHGGSLGGYKSDIFVLPDAEVGAVILTNANNGGALLKPFMRRLLEIVYGGKPEAADDVSSAAERIKLQAASDRARLDVPVKTVAMTLASRYVSPELGTIDVEHVKGVTRFHFAGWSSDMASRRNDDGTTSFVTVLPIASGPYGYDFVVGEADGRHTLTTRDGQHSYTYTEVH